MNIKEQIKTNSELTETALKEAFLKGNYKYDSVISAMKYSLFAGGKRIRPFLLIEFYKLCGGQNIKAAAKFAAAVEMIHTYSLIHDDLPCMDNDDLRRGKPSCHKQYGEDIALLAGDALLTFAFETALDTADGIASENIISAVKTLASEAGIYGMIGGQTIDIISEGKAVDEETLEEMYRLKTSALISASCKMGVILAGGNGNQIKLAEQYAEKTGLAFQIIDDILDNTSSESKLGKPIGSDIENNKTTLYSLYGEKKAREVAGLLTKEAFDILKSFEGKNQTLIEFTEFLLNREV